MRTDIVILGIIGILVINLAIFFIVKNSTVDKGLRNYLKKNYKD